MRAKTATRFKPRPGRQDAAQSAAVSRAIVKAATEAFLTHGFEAASMEVIACTANVPKSTLYKRYADKRALLAAVLDKRVSAWSDASSKTNHLLGATLEERLKRLCVMMLTRAADPEVRANARLAAAAWAEPEEGDKRRDVIGFSNMVDFLELEIRERSVAEGMHVTSPRLVATALMAMLSGWLQLRSDAASQADASAFAQTAVDIVMKGATAW